jgi:Uma2 family endonuclease
MAETPIHRNVMIDSITMLGAFFADEPEVYVSGNMMMYYVEGNADECVSPDVFVTRGIPKLPERRIYKLWVEGKGPDAVIEVTSQSTARVDQRRKFELYRDVLKVSEYFLFDPSEDYLEPALQGFRWVDGEYVGIEPVAARLPSQILGVHLERDGQQLRLFDPVTGVRLMTRLEALQAVEADKLRLAEEIDRLRRENEILRGR